MRSRLFLVPLAVSLTFSPPAHAETSVEEIKASLRCLIRELGSPRTSHEMSIATLRFSDAELGEIVGHCYSAREDFRLLKKSRPEKWEKTVEAEVKDIRRVSRSSLKHMDRALPSLD